MSTKIVIGIVGLPGSGKSTALSVIRQLAPIVVMGDVVRSEVRKIGSEINPTTLGKMSKKLREKYGDTVIAKKCVDIINRMNEKVIFLDGIRSMKEVNYFKLFWNFKLIAIISPDKIRHERLLYRNRADDSIDKKTIEERDQRELSFGLEEVITASDMKIYNNEDIKNLEYELLALTKKYFTGQQIRPRGKNKRD